MINIRCTAGLTAILVLIAAQGALAGLATDTNAFVDGDAFQWHGGVSFQNTPVFPQLDVLVEYAVYERDQFDISYPTNTLAAATGTQYVYAYQIFNDLDPHAGWPVHTGNEDYVQPFSVGLNDGDEDAANAGYVAGTGTVAPLSSNLTSASAAWTFFVFRGAGSRILYGDYSTVLYYTSPFAPEWDHSTVQGTNAVTLYDSLPSPLPEPSTLLLLTAGFAAVCRRKR